MNKSGIINSLMNTTSPESQFGTPNDKNNSSNKLSLLSRIEDLEDAINALRETNAFLNNENVSLKAKRVNFKDDESDKIGRGIVQYNYQIQTSKNENMRLLNIIANDNKGNTIIELLNKLKIAEERTILLQQQLAILTSKMKKQNFSFEVQKLNAIICNLNTELEINAEEIGELKLYINQSKKINTILLNENELLKATKLNNEISTKKSISNQTMALDTNSRQTQTTRRSIIVPTPHVENNYIPRVAAKSCEAKSDNMSMLLQKNPYVKNINTKVVNQDLAFQCLKYLKKEKQGIQKFNL